MTLAENVDRAIDDFNSIRQAIVDKGVGVPSGTPTRDFSGLIGQIQGGVAWPAFTGTAAASIRAGDMALGAKANADAEYGLNLQFITGLAGTARAIDFSRDGKFMAVAHSASPFILLYKIDGDNFIRLPNPSVLPAGALRCAAFSPDSQMLAVGGSYTSAPYFTAYKIDGETFTAVSRSPSTPQPSGAVSAVAINPNRTLLMVGHTGCIIHRINQDFTIAPIGNLAGLTASTAVTAAEFSPNGSYFACGCGSIAFVYRVIGETFTAIASLTTTGAVYGISYSPDGRYLACATQSNLANAGRRLDVYKIDGEQFTLLTPPAIPPAGLSNGVAFSPDGAYIAVASGAATGDTNFMSVYSFINEVITKLPAAEIMPPDTAYGAAFSHDGRLLGVAHNLSPAFTLYKSFPSSRVYPTSNFAILSALVGPNSLLSGLNLMAVGKAKAAANAGAEATMDIWIE